MQPLTISGYQTHRCRVYPLCDALVPPASATATSHWLQRRWICRCMKISLSSVLHHWLVYKYIHVKVGFNYPINATADTYVLTLGCWVQSKSSTYLSVLSHMHSWCSLLEVLLQYEVTSSIIQQKMQTFPCGNSIISRHLQYTAAVGWQRLQQPATLSKYRVTFCQSISKHFCWLWTRSLNNYKVTVQFGLGAKKSALFSCSVI